MPWKNWYQRRSNTALLTTRRESWPMRHWPGTSVDPFSTFTVAPPRPKLATVWFQLLRNHVEPESTVIVEPPAT